MKTDLQECFTKQLNENQRIIHKICKIYTNTPQDHEDLFQEIVVQIWKSYPSFRGDAKFSTWIYRIGLNTAIALFKKRDKSIPTEVGDSLKHIKITNDDNEELNDKIQTMYNAIQYLSDIEKALIMMFLDDKPYKEIGETLGITEGNARVKMNRAKEKLKKLIKQQ